MTTDQAPFSAYSHQPDAAGVGDIYRARGRTSPVGDASGPYTVETKAIETLDNDQAVSFLMRSVMASWCS
jgi:hypothetical protein